MTKWWTRGQKKSTIEPIMKHIGIFSVGAILLCMPFLASAETVVRIGDDISIDADQIVNGDYYVSSGFGGKTTMSGTVTEDMYAVGGIVTVNGTIGKDLSILGGSAQVHAKVSDDVRIVAGEVTIAEHVTGDVFVIGGTLNILSNVVVDGDVIFYGGTAQIEGTVKGSILGTAKTLRVDAEVGKNIDVKSSTAITLGDKAKVGGFVRYASPETIVRAQNASIGGEVTKSEFGGTTMTAQEKFRSGLIPVFITLFATLVIYLFFKRRLQQIVLLIHTAPLKSSVVGISVAILAPVVGIILLATVLGSLVGVLLFGFSIVMYTLGIGLCGAVFGSYLRLWLTRGKEVTLVWLALGTLAMHGVLFVPILGPLVFVGLVFVSMGGVVLSFYNKF